MEYFEITEQDKELIALAGEVIEKNYDDKTYNHTVGSAVRCRDGSIFLGVNCDGVHGSCAEFISIGAAITAGHREFDTIVASRGDSRGGLLPPCGNCRQMLLEYCRDVKVILNDSGGNIVKVRVEDLLPLPYIHSEFF
ncbi:MAG: cytidine deaminase [Defluviitaleaceae bacterium]|nr:cytidine deaminase [Defluviitaleaceae bacterium]